MSKKFLHLVKSYSKYKQKHILKKKIDTNLLKIQVFSSFSEHNIVFSKLVHYVTVLEDFLLICKVNG